MTRKKLSRCTVLHVVEISKSLSPEMVIWYTTVQFVAEIYLLKVRRLARIAQEIWMAMNQIVHIVDTYLFDVNHKTDQFFSRSFVFFWKHLTFYNFLLKILCQQLKIKTMLKFLKTSRLRKKLDDKYCFTSFLGLDPKIIAKYIVNHPNKSPLQLVYKSKDGERFEFDFEIRPDLSNLIGYVLPYDVDVSNDNRDHDYDPDEMLTSIILFRTIQQIDVDSMEKQVTVGQLRKFARTIHPEANIINSQIASAIWREAQCFYTMKSMLEDRGFLIDSILELCSWEKHMFDNSTILDSNYFGNGEWNYFSYTNCPYFVCTGTINVWLHVPLTVVD